MSKLLLIRHAETDMAGTFCGHSNPPVNARGHEQIRRLIGALQAETANPIDAVYTSDLQRAVTTADALAKAFATPFMLAPQLREMDFGEWETLTWQQVEQRDSVYARKWSEAYPNLPTPGGECFAHFRDRVLDAVDQLARLDNRKQIAVVTHAGVMRTVLTALCGLEEQEAWARTRFYCSYFQYTREANR